MKGLRKFLLGIFGLISFTVIIANNPDINPFNLGLGIGLVIAPSAIANIFEHINNLKSAKQK